MFSVYYLAWDRPLTVTGRAIHPGKGRGKMVNARKLDTSFVNQLPANELSPETRDGREGFVHPVSIVTSGCCGLSIFLCGFCSIASEGALVQPRSAERWH